MKAEADRDDQAGAVKAGRNSGDAAVCAEVDVATRTRTKAEVTSTSLMEAVVERGNLKLAYQRVVENKGAAGVDELTVSELLAGAYWPMAIRRVDIPKPQGGVRTLGIPTVVDRLIQQALHQVLQPIFEPTFSDASYGFRPGRNAHQALRRAQQYVPRTEGTPQGGPLSPLLSNILLNELDRELERRGHAFCRYADDCNIYVASERAWSCCTV